MRWITEKLHTLLKDVKKIGFLGYGRSNRAILEYLKKRIDFDVVIREERRASTDIPPSYLHLTGEAALTPAGEDMMFLSPSVRRDRPGISALSRGGADFSSDAELFFSLCETPVLAVSGSDGKSTTVKMAEAILRRGGARALACGNLGIPFVDALESDADWLIAEMSSFMLEYTRPRTRRALITNVTENHLDWHGSYEAYIAAKENLIINTDEAILSPDSPDCIPLILKHRPWGLFSAQRSYGELKSEYPFASRYFTVEDGALAVNGETVLQIAELSKKEPHNIKNALAAIALTHGLLNTGVGVSALCDFRGLTHRAETVYTEEGIRYIDSSIDSTPERTCATLLAMPQRLTILLGGRGKGLSYAPLADALSHKSGDVIVSGENCMEIYAALAANESVKDRVILAKTLSEAVAIAQKRAMAGDTILLSPASTSYDAFSDFEERGNKFKEYIKRKD